MKLSTVENVIERSSDLPAEQNFSIALTAKAIEVLSSQIYKDAHLAIVRELGTNAADSHIEAGKKNVPFDVSLPNHMSPELVIRDYGTGMAYEKVMTMYRTYFGSDKTNSNEVTGCLGLGSKSPLAYTDQFNVTSWYNGEKAVYTVYKNEKGLPAINRIYHAPSDEPTGVEVRISVKRNDTYVFKQKAIEVYRWFTPRPNVGGILDHEWPKEEIILQNDWWTIAKGNRSRMTVLMGNVAYNVDRTDLSAIWGSLKPHEQGICNSNPIIRVNIGDVDIAASRETLKFDGGKTYPMLKSLIKKMGEEIAKKCSDDMDTCKTHWEARKFFAKLKQYPMGNILPDTLKWKGLDLSTNIEFMVYNNNKSITYADGRRYSLSHGRRTADGSYAISTQFTHQVNIEPNSNIEFFIVDSKNSLSRISYYLRNKGMLNPIPQVIVISETTAPEPPTDPAALAAWTLQQANSKNEYWKLDDFLKKEHLKDVVRKTSELPDPPKNAPGFRSKSYQILSPIQNSTRSSDWVSKTVDIDEGGIYVEVYGNLWTAGDMKEKKADLLFKMEPLIKVDKIIGIRKRSLADFQASKKWKRLDEYAIETYGKNQAAKSIAIKSAVYTKICNMPGMSELYHLACFKVDSDTGLFNKLCNEMNDMKKASESPVAKAYEWALQFFPIKLLDIDTELNALKNRYYEYTRIYPMMRLIDIEMKHKTAIEHYVKLVDIEEERKVKKLIVQTADRVLAGVA